MTQYRAAAVLTILIATGQAFAGIYLTSGGGTLVLNPNNQRYTADAYNISTVFYWTEQTSHILANDLVVSILPPGSFPTNSTTHSDDESLEIPQGTSIDSYFLNYDPQSDATVTRFSFDDPILGLITNSRDTAPANDHFMLSDFLINPLVPAANVPVTHFDNRGTEPPGGDFIRWISATEIELNIGASAPGDQIRVITSPIPEPATSLLLGLGFAVMARYRGRKSVLPAVHILTMRSS